MHTSATTPMTPTIERLPANDPFAVEVNLTRMHAATEGWHPALREQACLAEQFPLSLAPLQGGECYYGQWFGAVGGTAFDDDVAALAHDYRRRPLSAIGFSCKSVGSGVVAYHCDHRLLERKIAQLQPSPATRALLDDCAAYWATHAPAVRLRAAYPPRVAERLPSDAWTSDSLPAYPLYRLAGLQLDYRRLLHLGLPGLRAAVAASPAAADLRQAWTAGIDLVATCCRMGAQQAAALSDGNDSLARIAASCAVIAERPPQTLHEAIQLLIVYKHCATVENWGRLDDILGEFLVADLESGRLDPAAAQDLVDALWAFIATTGNRYNERVMVGGRGRHDPAAADRFAALAIQATRRRHEQLPQLALRFDAAASQPQDPALLDLAYQALGEGCTFPMLYDDAVNVPAVMRAFGVDAATAEDYIPFGCGEYVLNHRSVGTPSGVINCCKVLEVTLFDGIDPISAKRVAPSRGRLGDFATFEALWEAYAANMAWYLEALAEQQELEYRWGHDCAGFNLASLLMDDCIARGLPLLGGGVAHRGGTMEAYGNTNAADSLLAIRELVFSGEVAAATLLDALVADFVGHEDLLARIDRLPHYGNDDPLADAMAVRVHEQVCRCTAAQAERVGLDSYLVVIINNSANTTLGQQCLASADGRRAAASLANANNPGPGRDRQGVTAFLNSLVKLDPALHAGGVQNMKFNKRMFAPDALPKLRALLAAFFAQGGQQAMLTVLAPDDLRQAMERPAEWQHLLVRVGGFSARFVDLPRDVQAEIAARTMHE